MQVYERGRFSEMRSDAVSDVVDGQSSDALDVSYLAGHQLMERGKIASLFELAANALEPTLYVFKENSRDSALMWMTLAVRQLAERGLAYCR